LLLFFPKSGGLVWCRMHRLIKLEDVQDKLKILKNLLEQDDLEAKVILEEIGEIVGYKNELIKIKVLIDGYDFEEALEILKKIMV